MFPVMNWLIKQKIEDAVVIREGGDVYDYWLDPPVPIYLQFYIFNLTNPAEFLSGNKPSLVQIGPYTYSERRVKFDIVFNDNGTVTYKQKRVFHFIPEMSGGRNESDMFLTTNPVYWALYSGLRYEYPEVRKIVDLIAGMEGEHVLMNRSMRELIWGYTDPMLQLAKLVDPIWFYTDISGYFINRNDSDDGVYTVFTGALDINQLGVINKYNGSSELNFWSTKWANMINGSDGTLGPPYLSQDRVVYSFASDVCRSITGAFAKEVQTSQGINLWRYQATYRNLANASVNPDNIGFCTPQDHCLGSGLYNISECTIVDYFHVPAALSFPHFLFADQKYVDAVEGLNPVESEHNAAVDLEPYTGLVLQAAKRLQLNVYMEPIVDVPETLHMTPVFMPIFWINESAVIDDESAKKFFSLLFTPLKIILSVEIFLISLGVLILIWVVFYYVRVKVNRSRNVSIKQVYV